MWNLDSFLAKRFRGCPRVKLKEIYAPILSGRIIPSGTVMLVSGGKNKINAIFRTEPAVHRGMGQPLLLNERADELGVSPEYLHWFLNQPEVIRLIRSAAPDHQVIPRVPTSQLLSLPIATPRAPLKRPSSLAAAVDEDVFHPELIRSYYHDYELNRSQGRIRAAVIHAACIAEMIAYDFVRSKGIHPSQLSADGRIGMKSLLGAIKQHRWHDTDKVPITHFDKLRQVRNNLVHAGRTMKAKDIPEDILLEFDHIIKHFGI